MNNKCERNHNDARTSSRCVECTEPVCRECGSTYWVEELDLPYAYLCDKCAIVFSEVKQQHKDAESQYNNYCISHIKK